MGGIFMSAYETTKHSKPKLLSIKISGKKKPWENSHGFLQFIYNVPNSLSPASPSPGTI